jgi:hypothetical protein
MNHEQCLGVVRFATHAVCGKTLIRSHHIHKGAPLGVVASRLGNGLLGVHCSRKYHTTAFAMPGLIASEAKKKVYYLPPEEPFVNFCFSSLLILEHLWHSRFRWVSLRILLCMITPFTAWALRLTAALSVLFNWLSQPRTISVNTRACELVTRMMLPLPSSYVPAIRSS